MGKVLLSEKNLAEIMLHWTGSFAFLIPPRVLQVHPNCFCIASFCTCTINIWSLTVPKIEDICQPKIANLEFGAEDMPNSTVQAPFATLSTSRLLALSQEILFALLRPLLSASSKLAIHCFCGSVRGFYSDLSQP